MYLTLFFLTAMQLFWGHFLRAHNLDDVCFLPWFAATHTQSLIVWILVLS